MNLSTIPFLESTSSATSWLLSVLLMAVAALFSGYLLKGIQIQDFSRALMLAIVLSLLNATIGKFLHFISTPLNWLSLGLFHFFVNALIIMLAAHFLRGVQVRNFWWALAFAVLMSIISTAIANFFGF